MIKQWGVYNSSSVNTNPAITLLITFSNINYIVTSDICYNDNYIYSNHIKSKGTSNFTCTRYNQSGQATNVPIEWIAIGY